MAHAGCLGNRSNAPGPHRQPQTEDKLTGNLRKRVLRRDLGPWFWSPVSGMTPARNCHEAHVRPPRPTGPYAGLADAASEAALTVDPTHERTEVRITAVV